MPPKQEVDDKAPGTFAQLFPLILTENNVLLTATVLMVQGPTETFPSQCPEFVARTSQAPSSP